MADRRVANTFSRCSYLRVPTFFFPDTFTFPRRLKLAGNVTSIKMEYSWGRGRILSVVEKLKICKGNRKPGKDRGKTEWSHRTCERIFLYLQGRWDSMELCNHGISFDVGIIIGRKLRGEFENSLHNNNIPIKRVNVSSFHPMEVIKSPSLLFPKLYRKLNLRGKEKVLFSYAREIIFPSKRDLILLLHRIL